MAASALVAQAAVTPGASTDAAPPAVGGSTLTLDKALSGELTTGDRQLDLLLESQRKGVGDRIDENPASRALPDRPAGGRQVLQPLPETSLAVPAQMPADAGRRYEPPLAMPERGQLANPGLPLPAPKMARDWTGGVGQTAAGPVSSGGSIYGDTSRLRSTARPLHEWIQEGVAFLKDHLFAILLAGAAIALLAFGLKAYSRRI